jgi:hypothetical protein
MKKLFIAATLLLCCGVANAADTFKIQTERNRDGGYWLNIQATQENVVIKNIVLNRGKCPADMLSMNNYSYNLPVKMNFAGVLKVRIINCSNLLEVTINTNPIASDNNKDTHTFTLK